MAYLKVNRNIYFICSTHGSYGQTERAILQVNDREISHGSYHWENRPWQSYDYDIAMNKAYDNAKSKLSKHHQQVIKKFLDNGGKREMAKVKKQLGSIAMIASLGDIFGTTKKESNDWKARMLKAGLENQGLIMPDDWDILSEEEKESRLNQVIAELGK